jgi:hypothetical protein
MKRRLFQFGGLVAAGTMLSGCWGGRYSWRQKITVVVSTPDGDKTGSAVTQVAYWPNRFSWLFGGEWESSLNGEAVVVGLGNQRFLFLLLSDRTHTTYVKLIAGHLFAVEGNRFSHETFRKIVFAKQSIIVPTELMPNFVTFESSKEPDSIIRVDAKNFSQVFGDGYSIKSVTLEITDEQVTDGLVKKALPWIDDDSRRFWDIRSTTEKKDKNRDFNKYAGPSDFVLRKEQ